MSITTPLGGEIPTDDSVAQKVPAYNEYFQTVIEPLLAGQLSISVAGSSNVTLTNTEGRNARMVFSGVLTGDIIVFIRVSGGTPEGYSARRFSVKNGTTGAFTLTVKTTATGSTGVAITQGATRLLEHDGTNVTGAGVETSGNPLAIGWAAYWRLDEASGVRYDSAGINHLTDNNTVTQAAGKIGNSAQFVTANSETLSVADNTALSMGDIDFTIAAWVYLDNKSVSRDIGGKWGASGQFEYLLEYDQSSDRFRWIVSNDGTAAVVVSATTFGSPSISTWYFIVAYHDSAGNVIGIKVNDGAADTTAHTTGVFNGTSAFVLGGRSSGSAYHSGRLDETGVARRFLSGAEMTELYNAGAGKTYPFA